MCDWKRNDPMMAFTTWRWRDDLIVTILQRKLTIRYKKKNKSIALPLLVFFWCRQDAFMGIWRSSTGPLRIIWTMWRQKADDILETESVNIFIMAAVAANSLILSCASEGVSEGGQKTMDRGWMVVGILWIEWHQWLLFLNATKYIMDSRGCSFTDRFTN